MPTSNPPEPDSPGSTTPRDIIGGLPGTKDTAASIYCQGVGKCSISHCPRCAAETKLEANDDLGDSPRLKPAPLRFPTERAPSPVITISSDSSSDSPPHEYIFPLPPGSSGSYMQASNSRSPFPPPYSPFASSTSLAKESVSRKDNNGITKKPTEAAQRIQSRAETQDVPESKPLPSRPPPDVNNKEREEIKKGKQHIFHFAKISSAFAAREITVHRRTSPTIETSDGKERPFPTPIPPPGPSLPLSTAKEEKQAKEQSMENERPFTEPQHSVTESRTKAIVPMDLERPSHGSRQRLTPEQMVWLHRNYRGEATFLKAWGLHITRDMDREQGLEILRELMAAELPKETEQPRQNRQQEKQRIQQGRIQSTSVPGVRERLHEIESKGNGHGFLLHPTSGSVGIA
ncbi:hypothetical protein F4677DRAFT_420768 [Hypoxylon crocopeplum]|nr:hypothetical protein F4677DRAFT_420768 [Hypoxylon crocopeplum]